MAPPERWLASIPRSGSLTQYGWALPAINCLICRFRFSELTTPRGCRSSGNCSDIALHPRHPRPFGTAVRFATGFLREQCSLVTILASQRACMRVVVRRLAAVQLEFPAYPAPVPHTNPILNVSLSKQKAHHKGELFVLLVETAGIEPASASPLQIVLHT